MVEHENAVAVDDSVKSVSDGHHRAVFEGAKMGCGRAREVERERERETERTRTRVAEECLKALRPTVAKVHGSAGGSEGHARVRVGEVDTDGDGEWEGKGAGVPCSL